MFTQRLVWCQIKPGDFALQNDNIGLTQIAHVGLFPPLGCPPVGARRIEWCLDVMTPCLNLDYPRTCDISASAPPRVPSCSRLWPSGGYCRTAAPMNSELTLAAAPSPCSCQLELATQQGTPLSPVFRLLHRKVCSQEEKKRYFEIKQNMSLPKHFNFFVTFLFTYGHTLGLSFKKIW